MDPRFFCLGQLALKQAPEWGRELDARLSSLGFYPVQVEWAGNRTRPILRLRIDREAADRPVSLDDCASVSRALEAWLDEDERVPERYVLEVSSPGVERPLVREADFRRFQGAVVRVKGKKGPEGSRPGWEGELVGLEGSGAEAVVRLRLNGGDEVRIPREEIEGARLVYEWKR